VSEGRTVPPDRRRQARAARGGHLPDTRLLIRGALLLVTALLLVAGGPLAATGIREGFARGLAQAGGRELPSIDRLAADALPVAGGALTVALLAALVVGGVGLLPAFARRRGGRGRPLTGIAPRPALLPAWIVGLAGALLILAVAWALLDEATPLLGSPPRLAAALPTLVAGLCAAAGGITLIVGIIAYSLDRARLLEALATTPAEARRERRELEGSPALRQAWRRRSREPR